MNRVTMIPPAPYLPPVLDPEEATATLPCPAPTMRPLSPAMRGRIAAEVFNRRSWRGLRELGTMDMLLCIPWIDVKNADEILAWTADMVDSEVVQWTHALGAIQEYLSEVLER